MIEADANTELINLSRTTEHEHAVADHPHLTPPPPRPSMDVFAAALSREIASAETTTVDLPESTPATQIHTTQPEREVPQPPDAAFRQTRLLVTAGLVVLLVVVWILQKRNAAQ